MDRIEDFIENKLVFERRLKNEVRNGVSENFLQFLINYHNSSELYLSEIELENMRLHLENSYLIKENRKLKDAAIYGWGWMQSILLKETRKLKSQINDR